MCPAPLCRSVALASPMPCCLFIPLRPGWEKFRNSLPQLADVPIFAIVECTKVPGMPEGSTETMTIKANSAEHRAIQAAMANAKPGDVICKTLDGCTVVYDTKPMSGLNTKYLEEGAD